MTTFFHCGEQLRRTLAKEINDVESAISQVQWASSFHIETENGTTYEHQNAYNRAFSAQFTSLGWEPRPLLRLEPKLIGDFRRGLVFVEIQFGNSSIVPTKPSEFFPTRPKSVSNMAEYDLAHTYLTVLPINVPVMLVGLLPEN